jgi:hypothetical protein
MFPEAIISKLIGKGRVRIKIDACGSLFSVYVVD